MRLGIISDVHGNVRALEAVLAHMKAQAVDTAVNLGDSVSAPLWPIETLALLDASGIPSVRGNHDRWLGDPARVATSPTVRFAAAQLGEADRHRLSSLPAQLRPMDGVLAVHGRPGTDTEYLLERSIDGVLALVPTRELDARLENVPESLILCGHSHLQHSAGASGGRLVVNPGSVGCPRYADNAEAIRNESGSPHARYAITTRRGSRWDVEFFALTYDWSEVAARAKAVGRPDWAEAFLHND